MKIDEPILIDELREANVYVTKEQIDGLWYIKRPEPKPFSWNYLFTRIYWAWLVLINQAGTWQFMRTKCERDAKTTKTTIKTIKTIIKIAKTAKIRA